MKVDWGPLRAELALWRAERLSLGLWWRDDDATAPSVALDRLLALGAALGLPPHLAVIPQAAEPVLAQHLGREAVALVHGWAHQNHAPEGAKKAEFGHPRDEALQEAQKALARMTALFGASLLPMFVPPWNRIAPDITAGLSHLGYTALSTYTPRGAREVAGLVQINTHVDPIHWKAGGGLLAPETVVNSALATLIARRKGAQDTAEPLGFLTHHLVHDEEIWTFTRMFLSEMLDAGALPLNLLERKDDLP